MLHAMRLSGKRLRYAAEFFAPLFPSRRTKRYLRRLAALQEALGIVNDGAVAGQLVRALPPARGQAALARAWSEGAVDGFAAARAAAARNEAEAAWARFRDADRFWSD
jgi:CHAD domain-containing protein